MDPTPSVHEFRIYGDDMAQMWAVVDEEDYHYLVNWRWSPKVSRGGKKVYLRRVAQEAIDGPWRRFGRVQRTLFLHQVVMKRKGDVPPSRKHVIPDHIDGDGLNCRRKNLRWATHSMNRLNIHGAAQALHTAPQEELFGDPVVRHAVSNLGLHRQA